MAEEDDQYFAPPSQPVEVFCLHCGNVYCSSEMKFVPAANGACTQNGVQGDWYCAAPGCDGIGYGFDVHSIEEWEANGCSDDDCDEEEFEDDSSEAYIEEVRYNEETDEFEPAEPDFLPKQNDDPEEAFREIMRDLNWWDMHDFPFARLWRMWVHFRPPPQYQRSDDSPPDSFREDDIPF